MPKFHHLDYNARLKLEALYNAGLSQAEIARQLGYSRATICTEIRRGLVEQLRGKDWKFFKAYSADKAQKDAEYKMTAKGAPLKIGHDYDLLKHIQEQFSKKYSPAAIVLEINRMEKSRFKTALSVSTIYNYIRSGVFIGLQPSSLPRGTYKKTASRKPRPAQNNILKPSIDDRDNTINLRTVLGHWEMDTVIGKRNGKNNVLLVLTERKTRYEIIRKIRSKESKYVVQALRQLKREYGNRFKLLFKTITVDNGCEFSDYKNMSQLTDIYYCHAYSSWERGSNENQNALIRRWIPKGMDINKITHKQVKAVQDWLNNYPRKLYESTASIQFAQEIHRLDCALC